MLRAVVLGLLLAAPNQEITAREADGQRQATLGEIRSVLKDLNQISEELEIASAAVEASGHAEETRFTGTRDRWRENECRYQGLRKATWTAAEEAKTARCVVGKWSVPGGLNTLRSVIACESGWYRLAYNPSGPYVGLAQHALSAWRSRVRAYEPGWWELSPRWQNSRSMLTVTARMAHAVGWGPWGCA
jgi:hypothetical protein